MKHARLRKTMRKIGTVTLGVPLVVPPGAEPLLKKVRARPRIRRGEGPRYQAAPALFDGLPLANGLRFQFHEVHAANTRRDGAEALQCPPHASLALDPDGQGFERSQQ